MSQDNLSGSADVTTFVKQSERALKDGRPLEALDLANEGLLRDRVNVRLRQLQGLALARSGALEQANYILGKLVEGGHRDEETLGMLARTHKDFGLTAGESSEERKQHFREAQRLYHDAYQRTGGYYPGINAATLATLLGDQSSAEDLAREVHRQCLDKRKGDGTDDYWLLATLGEAELNLRNWAEAERWYGEAATASKGRFGDRSSMRRQARLLQRHLGHDTASIDTLLLVPKVAVFVGHMCDLPGRAPPRFPAHLEPHVQNAIHERLTFHNALIGFSSAACGSDILFLETIHALQGEPNVVLPYNKVQFASDSVGIVEGWKQRYDDLLEKLAAERRKPEPVVEVARGKLEFQSVSYEYANLVLQGMALRRAKELDTELTYLAVWDGRDGDGLGGTASTVESWRKRGLKVDKINPTELLRQTPPSLQLTEDATKGRGSVLAALPAPPETKVLAMLFADAVGYSKMTEKEAVNFTRHCLGAICKLLLDWPHEAIVRESRGDGVYLAFETVRDAGLFALALCDMMNTTNWAEKNLPPDLKLRVGVHAGPVRRCFDPILGSQTWTGAQVSRAARFEQSATAGQVCASQQFAALATLEGVTEFTCNYVETRELPKQYGALPLYAVRRRTSPAIEHQTVGGL